MNGAGSGGSCFMPDPEDPPVACDDEGNVVAVAAVAVADDFERETAAGF